MKLQFRFALLMLTIFVALAGLLFGQRSFDLQRSERILANSLRDHKQIFTTSLEADGQTFRSFSEDYSFWDEMVNFVSSGDTDFAETNLDSGLQTFGADANWVFGPDGTEVYMSRIDESVNVSQVTFDKNFFAVVAARKFAHYYVKTSQGIFEIRAATIVPGDDPEHRTAAAGYWVVGRYLDQQFLNRLSALTQSGVTFTSMDAAQSDIIGDDTVSFATMLNDINGQPVQEIRSTSTVTLVDDLNALYKREVVLLGCIGLLIIAVISFTVWRFVLRPIRTITASIEQQSPTMLTKLAGTGSQFGNLARIVQQFFNQKLVIQQDAFKKDELEQLNQDKSAFLAVAAHELKAPSSIIKLIAEDLPKSIERQIETSVITKQLGIITHQAVKMTTMINDMRLAADGKEDTTYEVASIDFDNFMQDEITEIGYVINQRLIFRGSTGQHISADRERLSQVVSNLIRNAAKYSPADKEIIIMISADAQNVTAKIQDFGVGISQSDQEHIFERYYRAPSVQHTFQGLGLGLSICQTIIAKHGGRIWLESQPGSGSSFYFSLPITGSLIDTTPETPVQL